MACCRCHITLKTARFISFLLGHGIVDRITVILLRSVSTPPPRLSFQGLYIGFVLREAARCMLGEKVSSFLLTGRYFLMWNLSKTHPSYIPSELFFLKEPIDPKQAQTRAMDTPANRVGTPVYGFSNHHSSFQKLPWDLPGLCSPEPRRAKRVMALGQQGTKSPE